MDVSRFGEDSPGRLVKTAAPMQDHAFVPHGLPPEWELPQHLVSLLVEARARLGTLNGIGQTLPVPHLLLRPLQNREALTSSSLEGTHVTPRQLLLYAMNPREPHSADERISAGNEVHNYNRALQRGCELLRELPLCLRVIREMHGILMNGVRGRNQTPGSFRTWQVQIGSSARFVPPPHTEIDSLMQNLERYFNDPDDPLDPLVRCYIAHYQFEAIHPFGDGNGRVGRLLLALMIQLGLDHSMPWLYMSAYYERFKDEYIEGLFNVSAQADWDTWIEFCLRGTVAQCNDAIKRCNAFHATQRDFHDRAAKSASPRTHQIIDDLLASPIVNIPKLADRYSITYHTARADVKRLIELGILTELEGIHPKTFVAPELMRIAFQDDHFTDN